MAEGGSRMDGFLGRRTTSEKLDMVEADCGESHLQEAECGERS